MNMIELQRMCEHLELAADIAFVDREAEDTDEMVVHYLLQAVTAIEAVFNRRFAELESDALDDVFALLRGRQT